MFMKNFKIYLLADYVIYLLFIFAFIFIKNFTMVVHGFQDKRKR